MSATVSLPFFGGELSSFTPANVNVYEDATAGNFDATYSRCALHTIGAYAFATSPPWSSAPNLWCHAVMTMQNEYAIINEIGTMLTFYSGSTVVAQLVGNVAYNSYTLQLQTLQSGIMTNVGSAATFSTGALVTIDINLVASASGSAAFYAGGVAQASASGLNHTGWSGVTQIALSGCDSGPAAYYTTDTFWSQIICDNSSTIGRHLITDNFTNESAVDNAWTGVGGASNLADINDVPNNDATYIQAASGGLTDTFFQSGISFGSSYILGRGVAARARNQSTGGPSSIRMAIRDGGTNYVSPAFALGDGFSASTYMWTTNPATSGGWTPTTAAAVELGVQSQT